MRIDELRSAEALSDDAREIVADFFSALARRDLAGARVHLRPDATFLGVQLEGPLWREFATHEATCGQTIERMDMLPKELAELVPAELTAELFGVASRPADVLVLVEFSYQGEAGYLGLCLRGRRGERKVASMFRLDPLFTYLREIKNRIVGQ